MKQRVFINVIGGVAEVVYCPQSIEVVIRDFDEDAENDHITITKVDTEGEITVEAFDVEGNGYRIYWNELDKRGYSDWITDDYRGGGHHFRLLDDDKIVYFYGYSDDNSSFRPLDETMGSYGCTEIQYFENGKWETL